MMSNELIDTSYEALTSSITASLLSDAYMKAFAENPLSAQSEGIQHLVLSAHAETIVLLKRLLQILTTQSISDASILTEIQSQIEKIRQKVRTL